MVTDGKINRWNGVAYPAVDERLLDSPLLMPGPAGEPFSVRSGRRVNGVGLEVTVGTGPDSWTVAPGAGVLYSSTFAAQGGWRFEVPTAITANFGARPGGGTSRIDLIVARIYDSDISVGAVKELKVEIVTGTPAASPVAPAQPALSRLLATLTVPSSGAITVAPDTRVTVAAGGILPVATTAERNAISSPWRGLVVDNAQTGFLERYNGTAWVPLQEAKDSGWTAVTASSPFTVGDSAAVRVINGVAHLRGSIARASGSSGGFVTAFALPAGTAPAVTLPVPVGVPAVAAGILTKAQITGGGSYQIAMSGANSNDIPVGGVSWPIG